MRSLVLEYLDIVIGAVRVSGIVGSIVRPTYSGPESGFIGSRTEVSC
jgi:hypothetical protein